MDQRVMIMAIAALIMGFYLELQWLVISMTLVVVLGALINTQKPGKAPAPKSTADKVLYPVIYEDVGDPPFLYPEKFTVLYSPDGKQETGGWKRLPKGLGQLAGAGLKKALNYEDEE